jgi:hypothetical protein
MLKKQKKQKTCIQLSPWVYAQNIDKELIFILLLIVTVDLYV